MLFKVVNLKIGDRSHTTLCQSRIGLVESGLAYKGHTRGLGYFECEAHTCYASAYYQIIIFVCHGYVFASKISIINL